MAEKVDLKKSLLGYQAKHEEFALLELPERRYLMIDGYGDPNTSPAYAQALQALYPVAYKLKFFSKRELGRDSVVMPLEGLWWAKDMSSFTEHRDKSLWHWTMMIMVPDYVDDEAFAIATARAREKLGTLSESLRLESLAEGLCLQALHLGSYDDEGPLLAALHGDIMPSGGYDFAGRHHEVYLSDPRKTVPEKLKTIIRQPVRSIAAS